NYRSRPPIIDAANRVFARRRHDGVQLQAQRDGDEPVTYTEYGDEVAEAEGVAAQICRLREAGTPLRRIAVLFRVNAQSSSYEEALAARDLPYVVRGVERFFDRPEVRHAVTLLRGQAHAGNPADTFGDSPGEGPGEPLARQVADVLSGIGYTETAPSAAGAVRDRWESLHAPVSMARQIEYSDQEIGLGAFVADLQHRAHASHPPIAEGVTLATLHAAKGLEWDVVFVVGAHEGTVPIVHAATDAAVEEERRLFYVGLTRARDLLRVSWSVARSPGGRGSRRPSRFLDGLRPDAEPEPRRPRVQRE